MSSIGTAFMEPDGTIRLKLRAEGANGLRGDAEVVYTKAHPSYAAVLAHLHGLEPGESKPVPPWPTDVA